MTLQFSTTWRNASLDLLDSIVGPYQTLCIRTGAPPADCATGNSGTLLVEFDLQQPSWNPASGGSKSLADITLSVAAIGTGSAGHFRLYDGAASTCHIQGTITVTGGGGDMTADSVVITAGQTVNTTQFTLALPG
jgi:hypothetical protein